MDWLGLDWLAPQAGMSVAARKVIDTTGAILAGRGWYEAASNLGGRKGIYGGAWDGPVYVLTHRPDPGPDDPEISFVSEGIDAAISTALKAAKARNVVGGAAMSFRPLSRPNGRTSERSRCDHKELR
ncbi:MAG: hypothetical protein JWN52_4203 [Actinomycetia bacterium]|nr:hypothetical protein [Actinomycetes bacterium]